MTVEQIMAEVETFSIEEKRHLIQHIEQRLKIQPTLPDDQWRAALRASYGALAATPIEIPPDLGFEEREAIE
jgi:hypothetical protein